MSENYEWRTGRYCVFKNYYHLVFVTKYRRDVFTKEMIERMRQIFVETMQQMDGELLEFGGEDDHVHLMVSCHPKLAISNLVGKLKGKSSYFLRKEFCPIIRKKLWGAQLWSHSYCVVTCGGAPLEILKQYVENQRTPPSADAIRQSKQERGKSRPRKR
jgi:putative transposase